MSSQQFQAGHQPVHQYLELGLQSTQCCINEIWSELTKIKQYWPEADLKYNMETVYLSLYEFYLRERDPKVKPVPLQSEGKKKKKMRSSVFLCSDSSDDEAWNLSPLAALNLSNVAQRNATDVKWWQIFPKSPLNRQLWLKYKTQIKAQIEKHKLIHYKLERETF